MRAAKTIGASILFLVVSLLLFSLQSFPRPFLLELAGTFFLVLGIGGIGVTLLLLVLQ